MAHEFWYATKSHPNTALRNKVERLFNKVEDYEKVRKDVALIEQRDKKITKTINEKGDILSALSTPAIGKAVINEVPIEEGRIIAGQRMEQAFIIGKFLTSILLLLFTFIVTGIFLFRQNTSLVLKELGNIVASIAPKPLSTIIVISSSLLPLVALFIARYSLSFGALDYGLYKTIVYGAPHHYNVFWFMLLAMIYSPFCLGGLASPFSKVKWHQVTLLTLIYIGMFTAFLATPVDEGRIWTFINHGILLIVLLTLLSKAFFRLKASLSNKVELRGKLHVVFPSYALSAVLITSLSFFFHSEERRWAQQDNLFNSPHNGFSYYEDIVTIQAGVENRALLSPHDTKLNKLEETREQ